MSEFEFFFWIIFTLLFSLVPLKPTFKFIRDQLGIPEKQDTTPFLYEAGEHEHYSQLYRPGDKKYKDIVKRCNKAKPVN